MLVYSAVKLYHKVGHVAAAVCPANDASPMIQCRYPFYAVHYVGIGTIHFKAALIGNGIDRCPGKYFRRLPDIIQNAGTKIRYAPYLVHDEMIQLSLNLLMKKLNMKSMTD